ncbi:exosortase/archaeosortase family protein [Sphingomonas koreensis]|nr:exosortase/archaeosortase family protein [Sphingomonas koreensis]
MSATSTRGGELCRGFLHAYCRTAQSFELRLAGDRVRLPTGSGAREKCVVAELGVAVPSGNLSVLRGSSSWIYANLPLLVAGAAWVGPSLFGLASRYWITPQGAQGPIILVTGVWALLFQYRTEAVSSARPGSTAVALGWLALAVAGCVLARMSGFLSLGCLAAYGGCVALLYAYIGRRALGRLWLPLIYLLCVVPLPYSVEFALIGSLKAHIAEWSVSWLATLGYDVANSGSSLYVDQYEVLVEPACSGLNSIFSLTAIGLFYLCWRRRGDWDIAAVLVLGIVPIAIAANLCRVLLLLLLVHWAGVNVLATALHPAAGFLMFVIALGLLTALEHAFSQVRRRRADAAAA